MTSPSVDPETKSPSGRFQFSLRTLLIGVTLMSIPFAWIGHQYRQAQKTQAAIDWVEGTGGSVSTGDIKKSVWCKLWGDKGEFEIVSVDINADQVKGLSLLANLKHLETISFVYAEEDIMAVLESPVSDLSPLANLTRLNLLDIEGAEVSDLTPLANLKNLETLALLHTKVSDLTPLANLKNLKDLDLSDTPVTDLTPLANLKNLEHLGLYGTRVSDLTPLADLKDLMFLRLSDTPVVDLTPLANLNNLEDLDLNRTRVNDLTPLANLKNLDNLDLSGTQVHDLSPLLDLKNLKNLKILKLTSTPVKREQVQILQRALPTCSIDAP